MSRAPISRDWYRVRALRPRLRTDARIFAQRLRGETWYVLQDRQSGRFHRLSRAANLAVCLMDGRRTVAGILEAVRAKAGEDPPTQGEMVHLLAQLHAADLLVGDGLPDFAELAERGERHRRRAILARLRNPVALRIPLGDPDAFLEATAWLVRPLFGWAGAAACAALLAWAVGLAMVHWRELVDNVVDRAFALDNAALLLAAYVAVKTLHELGHAYATKAWGGRVHEFGVMLLLFVPAPYVDATSSAAFPQRWRRALVGAAGILVEAVLASLAMVVWSEAQPGLVRAVAFDVVLVCSVSTLLFNGNPLLRFDGYYVISDLVGIPNLASRANRYVAWLVQSRAFGGGDFQEPQTSASERPWLVAYAVLSSLYRLVVSFGIALVMASQVPAIGVGLALAMATATVGVPLARGLWFLLFDARLKGCRLRALAVTGGVAGLLAGSAFAAPLPYGTRCEGIVQVPEGAQLRAGTDGFVTSVEAAPGAGLRKGQVVVVLDDDEIAARAAVRMAQLAEARLRLEAARETDRVAAQILAEQVSSLERAMADIEERRAALRIAAPQDGRWLVRDAQDLAGRHLKKGEPVGYLVGDEGPVIRVAATQAQVDLVRNSTTGLRVRLAEDFGTERTGRILREVPGAQADVPSLALAGQGGGSIVLDPTQTQRPQAIEPVFYFDVALDGEARIPRLGGRAYVRFEHPPQPLGWRVARALRQIFLQRLHA